MSCDNSLPRASPCYKRGKVRLTDQSVSMVLLSSFARAKAAHRIGAALLLPLLASGCGSSKDDELAKLDPAKMSVEELYNTGVDAMQDHRYTTAAQQFDAVQQYYPYSSWAANAQLMQGYSQYLEHKYMDAIGSLDRFIQLHPTHKDIAYAYYLRALSFYEQIADIQRDQKGTEDAMTALQEVVSRFPDSGYARDARLKIDLCRDHLAGKEMEIGRYYEREHLYAAAVNRFQTVVKEYQTTNHVPEALHRLTELYLLLGLRSDARRTAAVLGHNYPGSSWYQSSWDDLAAENLVKGEPVPRAGTTGSGFFSRMWHSVF
ncbi:Lipoprotein, ComL family [Granulibacter bethesdensis]|uniref:Outer membrane protein assembly factor BamD n=2 Tax=Granulibacter bethesdensis TaxID=364410 RepID=A0AAN0VF50_9PROT|nr:outer membrane protein assembly factor BamD [Granulibacter bethesdensis]AHJ62189.1 Lipoprotein, ComL family [Granulibacter bethesdensis]